MIRELSSNHESRAMAVESLIPKDFIGNILDVGCGIGDITNRITEKYNITAFDKNYKYLEKVDCKKKLIGDIAKMPFKDKEFKLVICTSVLEHLKDNVFWKSIKELKRITNEWLIISVPYLEQLEYKWTKCLKCGKVFHVDNHIRRFSQKSLIKLFSDIFVVKAIHLTGKHSIIWDKELLKIRQEKLGIWCFKHLKKCPYCDHRQNYKNKIINEKQLKELKTLNRIKTKDIKKHACHVTILFERLGVKTKEKADNEEESI